MRHTDLKNDNKGFALTGVLVLLLILTFMGASLYAYSMISLRSVRFLSDQKKADYLARAGVEASSYAYKLAVDSNDTNAKKLIVDSANAGDEITAEPIYLTYKKGSANPYEYVSKAVADSRLSDSSYEVIGYYDVTIINRTEERTVNFLQTDTENNITAYPTTINDKQRQFKCVGHALSGTGIELENSTASSTKYGYMSEPVQGSGLFYDSEGANAGVVDGSANGSTATNKNLSVIGTYTTDSQLSFKTKHFGTMNINVGTRSIPLIMGYSSGNMILNAPTDSSGNNVPIKFKDNTDNIVTFAAVNDLFVKSDIDVTSQNSHFNIMTLKGNNIVVEGDIEISVYGFTQNSALNFINNISTVVQALQGKYRLSTVILGTPDFNTSTVIDPKNTDTTSLGRCGRVYFGGNVYVNVTMPNVGTYRYKAFSAGDAYYFKDSIDADGDGVEEAYSIDLLKYFLDDAIANKKYSENVLERFQDLIDLYYTDGDKTPEPYVVVKSGTRNEILSDSMRKIDRDKYGDPYRDLVPPDPTDASTLNWGQ